MTINKMNSPLFNKGLEKWNTFVTTYDGPYDLSKAVYAGMNNKIDFVCPTHGGMSMDAKVMMRGAKCSKCAFEARKGKNRMTQNTFAARSSLVHEGKYTYDLAIYMGQKAQVKIRCPTHGVFKQIAGDHLCGAGCPKCFHEERRGATQRDTLSTFKQKLHNAFGGSLEVVDDVYVNSQMDISIKCVTHNTTHISKPYRLNAGENPCPKCNHMKSKMEQEIADFLAEYTTVEQRNRSLIAPKEIDIWLPEYNIGIEFHGLFWHATNRVGKIHREKWQMAQQAGIRLVQIFEDEWLNKQEIVKARLLAFIGFGEKRDARKLELRNVGWKEAKAFLVETHIQGAGPVGTAYGLYEQDTLVAVATFGKSRSGAMTGAKKEGEFEVLRYASTGNVRGGFTRLFSAFKKDSAPELVISYCDLRYGTGKLYESAEFVLDGITEPDYWWVPEGKVERVSRYAVQKHKIAKTDHPLHSFYAAHKTEAQICEEAGWEKIHGVGNQKWVWRS